MHLGPTELIIILIIVVVLFGGGRIARLGGELGTAIKEFRRGLNEGDKKNDPNKEAEELPQSTAESK